ncbi:hypothetical protein [Roseomonas marmotae]|uniref:Uncharacterized protein n=1 Tax=Roseomonas marmotae TaxID=2768161 RepID=A0ABS3KIH4_9PROT|nr:hypothetical protein [Roseomonas marmotae]MBO1077279.1 hypothetical protein [Roseomonas marmotae]
MTTNTPSSDDLRTKLHDLEAGFSAAGTALLDAQAAHTNAVRRAISSGDSTAADATKAVLDACTNTHQQISTTLEIARRMLAEAVQHEKAQAEADARVDIATRLADLDTMAASADEQFAALVTKIFKMSEAEYAAFDVARAAGLRAYLPPQSRSALRSLASRFVSIADAFARGDEPRLGEAPVSKTARDVRSNLEGVFPY